MKKLIFKIIIFLISLFSININVLANDGKIYMDGYTLSGVDVFAKDVTYNSLDYNGWIIKSTANNYIYYCIDPATHMPFLNESKTNSYNKIVSEKDIISKLKIDENTLTRIKLLAYYGYGYKDEKYNHTSKKWYGITQVLIWRTIRPDVTWTFKTGRYGGIKASLHFSEVSELLTLVYNHSILPSFDSEELNLFVGDKITLEDTNNVLYKFNIKPTNNIKVIKKDNKLEITALEKTKEKLILEKQEVSNDFYLLKSNNVQDVITRGNVNNYKTSYVNVNIYDGELILKKIDKDEKTFNDKLIGSIISLYDNNDNLIKDIEITKEEEIITLENGSYYLKEKTPTRGYELNEKKYYFEISKENNKPIITIENNKIKGNLIINKLYGGSGYDYVSEEGACFDIYDNNDNLISSLKTNKNGKTSKTLEYGKYKIKQTKGKENYIFTNDFEVIIEESKDYIYNLKNIKKPTLIINKIDKDTKTSLSNAVIMIYDNNDNLLYEETTNNKGIIKIENMELGKYYFVEKESPKYYKLDNTKHYFEIKENGKIYDFNLENERILGNLEIIKKSNNLNLLKDATFGIYDNNDNLIYKETTNNEGIIKIENIKAGSYYLKELKAPYGYIKNDEIIEFEILNNELLTFEVINNKIEMPNTSKSININYLSGIIIILINISIGLYEKKYKDN